MGIRRTARKSRRDGGAVGWAGAAGEWVCGGRQGVWRAHKTHKTRKSEGAGRGAGGAHRPADLRRVAVGEVAELREQAAWREVVVVVARVLSMPCAVVETSPLRALICHIQLRTLLVHGS